MPSADGRGATEYYQQPPAPPGCSSTSLPPQNHPPPSPEHEAAYGILNDEERFLERYLLDRPPANEQPELRRVVWMQARNAHALSHSQPRPQSLRTYIPPYLPPSSTKQTPTDRFHRSPPLPPAAAVLGLIGRFLRTRNCASSEGMPMRGAILRNARQTRDQVKLTTRARTMKADELLVLSYMSFTRPLFSTVGRGGCGSWCCVNGRMRHGTVVPPLCVASHHTVSKRPKTVARASLRWEESRGTGMDSSLSPATHMPPGPTNHYALDEHGGQARPCQATAFRWMEWPVSGNARATTAKLRQCRPRTYGLALPVSCMATSDGQPRRQQGGRGGPSTSSRLRNTLDIVGLIIWGFTCA
uniref:Uncharacterized protein n=1 Tax=Mycena chlorophos TaxID=658473 RepID=A0ABQ0LN21_MYCCL|nr:predicted protein [Mycena chlorophos]